MYVIIAGINILSRRLVERLEGRHDVVVVEENEDKCNRLYSSSGATVINKSPATLTALEDAGITEADILISTMKGDNENMVVCSLAKKYGVPKVISRLEDDEYFDAFEIIGAQTIGHTDLLLSEFLSAVEHPYLVKLSNLSGDREILKASVKEDSGLMETTVDQMKNDSKFPQAFKVTTILKEDETVDASDDPILKEGDEIILVGPSEGKEKLDKYFQNQ
ncbi:MAG: potassium channel family protein [Candidatus Nanohaloarchaea archaeon]